mgnify:CR=1 FL=1
MKKICVLFATLIVFQSLCFVFMTKMYVNSDYKRYSLYMHPTFRADQFMIDHKTGRVWHLYAGGKNQNDYWGEMKRNDLSDFWDDDAIQESGEEKVSGVPARFQ